MRKNLKCVDIVCMKVCPELFITKEATFPTAIFGA